MSEHYTKAQSDAQATVVGLRIKTATDAATLAAAIDAIADLNIITDAERTKLAGLEGSKYLGTFLNGAAIPTVAAVAGSHAYVDSGAGGNVELWAWDVDDSLFKALTGGAGTETASTVKTKYESNANTNAFTDAEQAKLAGLTEAADITSFTAALDAALA